MRYRVINRWIVPIKISTTEKLAASRFLNAALYCPDAFERHLQTLRRRIGRLEVEATETTSWSEYHFLRHIQKIAQIDYDPPHNSHASRSYRGRYADVLHDLHRLQNRKLRKQQPGLRTRTRARKRRLRQRLKTAAPPDPKPNSLRFRQHRAKHASKMYPINLTTIVLYLTIIICFSFLGMMHLIYQNAQSRPYPLLPSMIPQNLILNGSYDLNDQFVQLYQQGETYLTISQHPKGSPNSLAPPPGDYQDTRRDASLARYLIQEDKNIIFREYLDICIIIETNLHLDQALDIAFAIK